MKLTSLDAFKLHTVEQTKTRLSKLNEMIWIATELAGELQSMIASTKDIKAIDERWMKFMADVQSWNDVQGMAGKCMVDNEQAWEALSRQQVLIGALLERLVSLNSGQREGQRESC